MTVYRVSGKLLCAANWASGIWWLRIRRSLFVVKARWNDPLFSERYSYYVFRIPFGFGWRFIFKRDLITKKRAQP